MEKIFMLGRIRSKDILAKSYPWLWLAAWLTLGLIAALTRSDPSWLIGTVIATALILALRTMRLRPRRAKHTE